jgi:orotate phosphoribosyltransferase
MGGLIIGHEVAEALGVPFRFTERKDGRMELRRGFALRPGERVAIVEDVVTTGRSTEETLAVARAQGAEVVAVGSILDRTGGRQPFAVPYVSLLALELQTWPAGECPLCREGGTAEKPGSRA